MSSWLHIDNWKEFLNIYLGMSMNAKTQSKMCTVAGERGIRMELRKQQNGSVVLFRANKLIARL